jgi:predicted NUDIX family NTP pyrophosphohydrolase
MPESAGILMYRWRAQQLQVLLAHPGGPFWESRDRGAWTVPKGMIEFGEDALDAAQREFFEEVGFWPEGPFLPLGSVTQRAGKVVTAWACEGDFECSKLKSITTKVVWPPGSGRWITVPEIDRCEWYTLADAAWKINSAQVRFLERLKERVESRDS